jgi:hypothetical protein
VRQDASRGEWFARISVGPLALAGFFLPWAHGPGPLAATEFTGYKLVGYAGRLQALDLSPSQSGTLWAIRLLILGVAVAAVWQSVLAPWARHHPVYRWSGWYLVLLAAICAALGVARHGIVAPPPGLALLLVAAAVFAAVEVFRLRRRGAAPISTAGEEPSTFGV